MPDDRMPDHSSEVEPSAELIAEMIALGFSPADAPAEAWEIANAHLGGDCILLDETGQRIPWPTVEEQLRAKTRPAT